MIVNKGGTGRLRWAQPQELQLPKRDLELVQSWIHFIDQEMKSYIKTVHKESLRMSWKQS